jgi:hypothetical protein
VGSTSSRHAIAPERMVLFCPDCRSQHEDLGEWAERPHRTHRCLFCEHEWKPLPFTTVGVATPAGQDEDVPSLIVPHSIFERMPEYSATLPTGPREWFFWRRRWPYRGEDRTNKQLLAVAVPMPDDPPGEISIVWRRLFVAEWLVGDALLEVFCA